MSHHTNATYVDPWTRAEAVRAARTLRMLGQLPADHGPPPAKKMNVGMLVGWGAVVVGATGLFYAASTGLGTRAKPVRANRRRTSRRKARRRTSRRPVRRNSRRRVSRNLKSYKALSASARARMPESSFALSGHRWPIKGPPGSSRARDKWQALQAIRYLNMGRVAGRKDYLKIRNAIIREYGSAFWRSYDGPSWSKVEKAKRRRSSTRRSSSTSRRGSRRLAANTSRRLASARARFKKAADALRSCPRDDHARLNRVGREFQEAEKALDDAQKAEKRRRRTTRNPKRRSSSTSRRGSRRLAANTKKTRQRRAFRFARPDGKGYKLVVMARTLPEARRYLKSQSNSAVHRGLKYQGEGHPTHPENWAAAIVRNPKRRIRRTSRR